MRRSLGFCSGLKARFAICYLLLTIVPIAILCAVAYAGAAQRAQSEINDAQLERAYADRQYMQLLFQSVESKYDLFDENATLSQIMDSSFHSNRSVMFSYVSEISSLLAKARRSGGVSDIELYTSNEIAAEILPGFHRMSELDSSNFPEQYFANRDRALFQHFWTLNDAGDFPELVYYAGLFSSELNKLDGVLRITCTDALREMTAARYHDEEAFYLYFSGEPIYTSDAERRYADYARGQMEALSYGENVSVHLDRDASLITCVLQLPEQRLALCRIYPVTSTVRLPGYFLPALLLLVALSLAVMTVIFHPLYNITALARHMKSVQSIPMQPYPRKSRTREVKTIIEEYNALGRRINELSQTVNQKELLLRNAQIERLQSQLNPHFFYGTLESIRMIAEVEGQAEIAEIAYDFSSLMRYSLSKDFFVPLSQEIDIVRQYIAIQKKRIGNRFELTWRTPLGQSEWRCPKFVLFSMVENAFTHDVNHSRQVVHIEIEIREDGDRLELSVRNDGPGIDPERLSQIRYMIEHPEERGSFTSQNNGRSIFNINDRLQFYYGEDYGFCIDSVPERYTLCSVSISRGAKFMGKEDADAEADAD